ncbi:MAG: sigma 54-interacting transcriptional regulator [Spirochaetales bacterium]|nr:sigma 54-interacting transcriptional regulator [Spirochaetales bacterium]
MNQYSRIPDPLTLKREIEFSHKRCCKYNISPNDDFNPCQKKLTQEELKLRLEENREFLNIAISHMEELYQFVEGAGFAVNIADKEGYILHLIGDRPLLEQMKAGNCWLGYRWREEDVGTSAISLSLARQIPVQINDEEHYCHRGYGNTCSAAPVFDPDNALLGIISMSGPVSRVHPHTLGMVITTNRAIENQFRIQKASMELSLRNNYMRAIINSIDSGVMTIDKNGIIREINQQGRRILKWRECLEGRSLASIIGKQVNLQKLTQPGNEIIDRELSLMIGSREIKLLYTLLPIFDSMEKMHGFIFVFNTIKRIRKLVNEMAGTQARFTFEDIIGISGNLLEAKKMAITAAGGKSTVLLLGETGTGKELFAQAIHNYSDRQDRPFLAINCGAIPRDLLESELFGYAEGSFTGAKRGGRPGKFELADCGTLFLDEIGDMTTDMQVKLLRVLQTGEVCRIGDHKSIEVDVRIIAATNADLKEHLGRGSFREDLFYRLSVFSITIPPLRERHEDVLPLAKEIIKRRTLTLNKPKMHLKPNAEKVLTNHAWPGNVRELENVLERAVNLSENGLITPRDLGLTAQQSFPTLPKTTGPGYLEEVEKQAIGNVLEDTGYNISEAAKTLGISRATLYKKIKKYKLIVERSWESEASSMSF